MMRAPFGARIFNYYGTVLKPLLVAKMYHYGTE